MIILIGITIAASLITIAILLLEEDGLSIAGAVFGIICIGLSLVSLMLGIPTMDEYRVKAEKYSQINPDSIKLAVDSIEFAHKTMDEFNDARFQKTAQESYLVWGLLHSIYKQDSVRWYKDIRTSPEYKELDRFLVGDWEDFYLY